MNGVHIKFYMHENREHEGILLYEWLLEKAKKLGFHGGSVFKAIAGFGRHGVIYEEGFFELASNVPVEVVFILSNEDAETLFDVLRREKLDIFYVRVPVDFGVMNGKEL